ncbi:MAG: hypothetical protein KDC27_16885, partial [Acidobacteria bacterium]|nr:hypothetical protein [Acidobacteriota bacterium]
MEAATRNRLLAVSALALEGGFGVLAYLGDFESSVVEFVFCFLVLSLFYLAAAWAALSIAPGDGDRRLRVTLIVGAAVVFRLTVAG